jgi:formylglycine-generating enzyme required for sulfatase activity
VVVEALLLLSLIVWKVWPAGSPKPPDAPTVDSAGSPGPPRAPTVDLADSAKRPNTLTVDLGNGVELDLILIRPGTFTMGSETNGKADQTPAHSVTIAKPFYIGKYEVTQEQWQAVMGANPSVINGARLPVENVSWNDCQEFVGKLNEEFPGRSFRLPTEAEWEYACRSGRATVYCFGDEPGALSDYAWFAGNADQTSHPVGEKMPNAWGLYDMHGNVWERCQSLYRHYPYADDGREDLGSTAPRAVRGGSWHSGPEFCRSADRLSGRPTPRYDNFGCRVALTVEE